MNKIAYRYWSQNYPIFYVANLKGKVGDWGYSDKACDAIPLTTYWQKRFAADCKRVGVVANFVDVVEVEKNENECL